MIILRSLKNMQLRLIIQKLDTYFVKQRINEFPFCACIDGQSDWHTCVIVRIIGKRYSDYFK